jgi:predicted enzyme involved in methoxymalonyl-ACP biosynthesis
MEIIKNSNNVTIINDCYNASYESVKAALEYVSSLKANKKIAVLGGSTTNDFIKTLEVFLLSEGIEPEFYESEYNRFWQDAMFENPELSEFSPDIIYIHTSYRNIASFLPEATDAAEDIDNKLNERYSYYEKMWKRLASVYSCPIIQNNFELPPYRLFGNRDCYDIHGSVNFITRLNLLFSEYAQQNQGFYICDINYIAACFGLDKWFDDQAWYMYKYACSLDAVPYVTKNLSNIIKSIFGKNKKVLALDLDNTLILISDSPDGKSRRFFPILFISLAIPAGSKSNIRIRLSVLSRFNSQTIDTYTSFYIFFIIFIIVFA